MDNTFAEGRGRRRGHRDIVNRLVYASNTPAADSGTALARVHAPRRDTTRFGGKSDRG
jgi:hypothetical protein